VLWSDLEVIGFWWHPTSAFEYEPSFGILAVCVWQISTCIFK